MGRPERREGHWGAGFANRISEGQNSTDSIAIPSEHGRGIAIAQQDGATMSYLEEMEETNDGPKAMK